MKMTITVLIFSCISRIAFSQDNFLLRKATIFKDTSFKLEIGNKVKAISVSTSLTDSIFAPFKCKVVFVSNQNNIFSVTLKTDDQYYLFLTNLKSTSVKKGQDLQSGIFIGSAFYDDRYKTFILDISIKKENLELNSNEILKYLKVH